jgi:hypothetical protein
MTEPTEPTGPDQQESKDPNPQSAQSAQSAHGSECWANCGLTDEHWREVPGFEGSYEVSDRGRIRSLPRVVIRRNNVAYTVQARILRARRHRVSGLLTVGLAQGRRGHCHYVYPHKLVEQLFGEKVAA